MVENKLEDANAEGQIQKSRDEIVGEIYPAHRKDEEGRESDSIRAKRIWLGGARLLTLASGEQVKVLPGEWEITLRYDVENEKGEQEMKEITLPFPDDAVRSLFSHLFDFIQKSEPQKTVNALTPEELKAAQQKELEELSKGK